MYHIKINFLDDAQWIEADHPRAKSGPHGGQFVAKGQEGGKVSIPKHIAGLVSKGWNARRIAENLKSALQHHVDHHLHAAEPYLVAPLVDIVDGTAVLDENHARRQPDWTYNEVQR